MTLHKITHKTFTMPDNEEIQIMYWSDKTKIYVAAFDKNEEKVSNSTYSAEVDGGDSVYSTFKEEVIKSLASTIENDLKKNPMLHYKLCKTTTDKTCHSCGEKFHGVFKGIFNGEKKYVVECPKCKEQICFSGEAGFVGSVIPNNAVIIKEKPIN